MQNAGRILLMPKGDYAAGTTYEMLDLVNHGGASWVCKKGCTGQTPSDSNTEYWQRFGTAVDMSNYLPLTSTSSKTVEVQADTVLKVKNTGGGDYTWLQFLNNVGTLGYFGFNKNKAPLVSIDGNPTTLLHTGNKPTGTYTGTGETKTINTGGIGDCAIVWRDDGFFSILTYGGVINGGNDGAVSCGTGANCKNGNITVAGSDKHYNESGVKYSYRLL